MSGSRRGRRLRFVASTALALVTAGLVGVVVVRSWQSTEQQRTAISLERSGIAYLGPEIRLIAVLAGAEITVARGAPVDTAQVQTAEAAVDAAADVNRLHAGTRWPDLRGRIDGLTRRSDSGPGAVQAWDDVVSLAGDLLDAVVAAAGLDLDPQASTQNLIDAAVHGLPSVVIYAGHAGAIAAQAVGGNLSAGQQTELAVYTYQVALLGARLDTQVTSGADTAADVTTQMDTFESAVGTFVPPSVVTRPIGSVPLVGLADGAQGVQSAALALATDLLLRADAALADRDAGLRNDGIVAISVGVALLVTAAALVWLLAPARRRAGDAAEAEETGDREAGAEPADLIDARDLLGELVHVGRGVRSPTTGESRTDAR
jgi:hypothetical protein